MEILPLTPASIPTVVDQLAWVYRETFSLPPYNEPPNVLRQFQQSILTHTFRPDFTGLIAHNPDNDEIVGFCYGYRALPGQWWYNSVTQDLAPAMIQNWFSDCFELVDLAVVPHEQGKGIGGSLLDMLTDQLPHRTGALSTMRSEKPTSALYLYQKRGWQILNEHLTFPGIQRPYMLMGKEL